MLVNIMHVSTFLPIRLQHNELHRGAMGLHANACLPKFAAQTDSVLEQCMLSDFWVTRALLTAA